MWFSRKQNVETDFPTVFHITHHKSGSQWIYAMLQDAFPEQVVPARQQVAHVTEQPLEKGKIYPCVYLDKSRFDSLEVPEGAKKFVIIRDLRDTLVSLYFSVKISHVPQHQRQMKTRELLKQVEFEQGLHHLMTDGKQMNRISRFQKTWLESGELVVKYEDLIADTFTHMMKIFVHCGLPLDEKGLERICQNRSFEKMAGRERGQEDVNSHLRKGIAGDWQNYLTGEAKDEFKRLYTDVLVATGYEKDENW